MTIPLRLCGAFALAALLLLRPAPAKSDERHVLFFKPANVSKVIEAALPRIVAELRLDGTFVQVLIAPPPAEAYEDGDQRTSQQPEIVAAADEANAAGALLMWPIKAPTRSAAAVRLHTLDARRKTWLSQTLVIERDDDAGSVLAIRAVEALRAHFLRRRYEPLVENPPALRAPPPASSSAPPQELPARAAFTLGLGGSVRGETDGGAVTFAPHAVLGVQWPRWALQLYVAPFSTAAALAAEAARLSITERQLHVGLDYFLLPSLRSLFSLRPYLSAKAGAGLVQANGTAQTEAWRSGDDGYVTAMAGGGAGVRAALGRRWDVTMELAALAYASEAVVLVGEAERQRLGRPRLQLNFTFGFVP